MVKEDKDKLVTSLDIRLYRGIINNPKASQKDLCVKEKINQTCLSRRLPKLILLGFIEKVKIEGKNQNRLSIKNGFLPKIKNLISLFEDKI
jgi:DNA-binding HxlR family transcriptional regulator